MCAIPNPLACPVAILYLILDPDKDNLSDCKLTCNEQCVLSKGFQQL